MDRPPVDYVAQQHASYAVEAAVKRGEIPAVTGLACFGCDGAATEYHHHLGYAKEHWLDVRPYCLKCHRAEHARLRRAA